MILAAIRKRFDRGQSAEMSRPIPKKRFLRQHVRVLRLTYFTCRPERAEPKLRPFYLISALGGFDLAYECRRRKYELSEIELGNRVSGDERDEDFSCLWGRSRHGDSRACQTGRWPTSR